MTIFRRRVAAAWSFNHDFCFASLSRASLSGCQFGPYLSAASYLTAASRTPPRFANASPQALTGLAQWGLGKAIRPTGVQILPDAAGRPGLYGALFAQPPAMSLSFPIGIYADEEAARGYAQDATSIPSCRIWARIARANSSTFGASPCRQMVSTCS